MKRSKLLILFFILFFSFLSSPRIFSMNYELGFRVIDNSGNPVVRKIIVYEMINHNLVKIDSGYTVTNFNTWPT